MTQSELNTLITEWREFDAQPEPPYGPGYNEWANRSNLLAGNLYTTLTGWKDQPTAFELEQAIKEYQCPHPPTRLYAWYADTILCVCCNDCGKVLKGGAE